MDDLAGTWDSGIGPLLVCPCGSLGCFLVLTLAREIGNVFVLHVEMLNDKHFVQFTDVGEMWTLKLIYSPRNGHPTPHQGQIPVQR